MKRQIVAACGALAVASMTAGLTAQTTGTSQPRGTETGNTVTVRGCLKTMDELSKMTGTAGSTAGTTSTTGAQSTARPGDMQFVLTDAEMTAGGTETRSGAASTRPSTTTPETTTQAASLADHEQLLLRADGTSVNLKAHVNHEVEVTGRMSMAADSSRTQGTAGTAGTTGTPTTPTTPRTGSAGQSEMTAHADASKLPTLTVSSVKMVSATCS